MKRPCLYLTKRLINHPVNYDNVAMQDQLSQVFAALADPTRRSILARLSKGEASVSDLAQPFLKDMSLPAVTKHLKVLERAGLVTKGKEAQWRPCKLNGAPLKDASDWMEQYRVFWEESFDRLDEYLKTVTAKEKAKGKRNGRGKQTQ
jgi:DNA-binding transcriptional ArsR family regulator